VVIEPDTPKEISEGGIILPQTSSENTVQTGTVIAVGSGKIEFGNFIPTTLKVNDKVLFAKFNLSEVEIDGKKYLIARETDIYAILEEK
jgi:chaperonin GroES